VTERRGLPLGFALSAALLAAAPHLFLCARLGTASPPVPLSTGSEEYFYLSRLYSCFRGSWLNGTSYIAGAESAPWMIPNVTEAGAALLAWPLQDRPQALMAWTTWLFSFLAAASLLWVFRGREEREAPAVAASLLSLLLLGHWLHRPIQPQANAFLYILAFGQLWRLSEKPDLARAALYGVFLGLMPYLYVFYFMFLGLLTALVAAVSWARGQRNVAKALGLSLGVAALVMVPYAAHNAQLRAMPDFFERLFNNGFISSHAPSLMRSAKVVFAALLLLALLPSSRERWFFGLAALSVLGVYNQQVVTGLQPHEGEFHMWRVLYLPLAACLHLILSRAPIYKKRAGWAAALLLAAFALQQASVLSKGWRSFDKRLLDYVAAFERIRAESPGAVVASGDSSSWLVPVVARGRIFHGLTQFTVMTRAECWRRNFEHVALYQLPEARLPGFIVDYHYYFFGLGADMKLGKDRVGKALKALTRLDFSQVLHVWRHSGEGQKAEYEKMTGPVVEAYRAFAKEPASAKAKPDYLVYGPLEREEFPEFSPEKAGEVVWKGDDVIVIRPN
jgi:hypothetical protein